MLACIDAPSIDTGITGSHESRLSCTACPCHMPSCTASCPPASLCLSLPLSRLLLVMEAAAAGLPEPACAASTDGAALWCRTLALGPCVSVNLSAACKCTLEAISRTGRHPQAGPMASSSSPGWAPHRPQLRLRGLQPVSISPFCHFLPSSLHAWQPGSSRGQWLHLVAPTAQ